MKSFNCLQLERVIKNKNRTWVALFILMSGFSISSYAMEAPASFALCVSCHGEQAQGNQTLNAPSLAGQSEQYLILQLNKFSQGQRGQHQEDALAKQMIPISTGLSSEDINSLAKYISGLPVAMIKPNSTGDLKNGSRYYQGKCGACHGGKAQGNSALKAPMLANQNLEYLRKQMQNFAKGIRGGQDDDKYGRQMAMMAKTTSGEELEDILHFIAQQ